jgi:hypothetical protein
VDIFDRLGHAGADRWTPQAGGSHPELCLGDSRLAHGAGAGPLSGECTKLIGVQIRCRADDKAEAIKQNGGDRGLFAMHGCENGASAGIGARAPGARGFRRGVESRQRVVPRFC